MLKLPRQCLYLGLILGFSACQSAKSEAQPTEEEINILTEALYIEGVLQDFTAPLSDSLADRYYTELYDRYGIDGDYLDQLRDRYDDDIILWEIASDTISARLERLQYNDQPLFNPEVK